LISEAGNQLEIYIELPNKQPSQASIDPSMLALELSVSRITGIEGFTLIEEEILPDGTKKVSQQFCFAPDTAYALFKYLEEIDRA
jgi:hypothetical protein